MMGDRRNFSFTLIEVLAAVAIVAILGGLTFSAYRQAVASRERVRCLSSLRQWTIALTMYANEHEGIYPPSGDLFNRTPAVSSFMTNYLQIPDAGQYTPERLPLAMCKSGVATYQNNTLFVGWSLLAGYSGPSPLQNRYAGVNFSFEQTARDSGLAIIACVTASDAAGQNWTGHGVRYDPASRERPPGQMAGWPDGRIQWVNFDDLEVAVVKFGSYYYYMPRL